MISYYIPQSDVAAVGNPSTVTTIHRVLEQHIPVTNFTVGDNNHQPTHL